MAENGSQKTKSMRAGQPLSTATSLGQGYIPVWSGAKVGSL